MRELPRSHSTALRSIQVHDDKFRYDELIIIVCVVVALCSDYKSVLIAVAQYFAIPFHL